MSTPTAIEIVKEMQLWRRGDGKYAHIREAGAFSAIAAMPYSPEQFGEALDTVLEMADRYQALEAAHDMNVKDRSKINGAVSVSIGYDTGLEYGWKSHNGTLAELADNLMKDGTK